MPAKWPDYTTTLHSSGILNEFGIKNEIKSLKVQIIVKFWEDLKANTKCKVFFRWNTKVWIQNVRLVTFKKKS